MGVRSGRVPTGCDALDGALGGGLPRGYTLLVEGPQGVGSTEFALTLLRAAAKGGKARARFATALRRPERVAAEVVALFDAPDAAKSIEVVHLGGPGGRDVARKVVAEMNEGDAIVLESAAALARSGERDVVEFVQELGDVVEHVGGALVILHAPGTLPPDVEAGLQESVDAVFSFSWRDGGQTKRRALTITKLRGLSPALDGEQVPIFEAALRCGVGFSVSRVRSVV